MIEVKAYKCECGKKYHSKQAAIGHEKVCRCWANPKHRTCKTCKWGKFVEDNNGMQDEPALLHIWKEWKCFNPDFKYEQHFTAAHSKAPTLCIKCPVWANKELK